MITHHPQDVKELRDILDKTKQLNFELEKTIQACQEGIYICDENTVALRVNKAYERISGMSEKEMIGKTSAQIKKQGIVTDSVAIKVLEEGRIVSMFQTFSSGKEVLATGTPVYDDDGRLFRIVVTARDVTELKEMEEKLKEEEAKIERYLIELNQYKNNATNNSEIIARSSNMQLLIETITRVAPVDSPVLLLGESGTGKEVMAKLIHDSSSRSKHSFIKINCAAIPSHLLESELFGYVKGAFTGADNKGKVGLFELADNGSLFLDEIGELPLALQVKLLRVLQDFEVQRLGSTITRKVNVRIISATNRNLEEMIRNGEFREDLFYRINVIPLSISALRDRKEDIPPLIYQKLKELSVKYNIQRTMSSEALEYLEQYSWPGNIRELQNVIERLFVISNHPTIEVKHLPTYILREIHNNDDTTIHSNKKQSLKDRVIALEKQIIIETLKNSNSMRDAAKELKIDASTLTRKCQKYGISIHIGVL
jgi:PAS domain S-box-containing protein